MKPREILRKYPVGRKFKIGVIHSLELMKLENGHPGKLVKFETDLAVQAEDVTSKKYRWLVYTDRNGDKFGLSVERLLSYETRGNIEIYRIDGQVNRAKSN